MQPAFDVIVRGGTVADGGGGELYEADVGVRGGLITALGRIAQRGSQEIEDSRFSI